jgi:hypothetical protein
MVCDIVAILLPLMELTELKFDWTPDPVVTTEFDMALRGRLE